MEDNWIYTTDIDNSARFTLGRHGTNMLLFIGINPSTAIPNDLDRTVKRVEDFVSLFGYDGWVMLNIYPQRATNPNGIHLVMDNRIHQENLEQISILLNQYPNADICASWGTLINKRPFLRTCLREVAQTIGLQRNWFNINSLTAENHPRHPLYLRGTSNLNNFDISNYINNL